jgi:hypothetical protein
VVHTGGGACHNSAHVAACRKAKKLTYLPGFGVNHHYPPLLVNATPDAVLTTLRDQRRQLSNCDPEANPTIDLTHDSTIADWRAACDLLPWRGLAKALNTHWSVKIPLRDWRRVLTPARSRRLRGVCELLARHAQLPRIRPATVLGKTCAAAGAFLTVRSMLAAAGADVSQLTPSTPLDEFTGHYPVLFVTRISQLAPGQLPPATLGSSPGGGFGLGTLVAAIVAIVAGCEGATTAAAISAVLAGVLLVTAGLIAGARGPGSVSFGELKTFRDLSRALAAASG